MTGRRGSRRKSPSRKRPTAASPPAPLPRNGGSGEGGRRQRKQGKERKQGKQRSSFAPSGLRRTSSNDRERQQRQQQQGPAPHPPSLKLWQASPYGPSAAPGTAAGRMPAPRDGERGDGGKESKERKESKESNDHPSPLRGYRGQAATTGTATAAGWKPAPRQGQPRPFPPPSTAAGSPAHGRDAPWPWERGERHGGAGINCSALPIAGEQWPETGAFRSVRAGREAAAVL